MILSKCLPLTFLILSFTFTNSQFFNLNLSSSIFSLAKSKMSNAPVIIFSKVSLLAREENLAPLGISPNSNRDIGFASVFLNVENLREQESSFVIKNIEIRSASNIQLENFTYKTQVFQLKPLEKSQIVIHLTNTTGFSSQDFVRVIISYQINSQVNIIESELVKVNRY